MTSVSVSAGDWGWRLEGDVEQSGTVLPDEILMAKAVCRRDGVYVAGRWRFLDAEDRRTGIVADEPGSFSRIGGTVRILGMRYPERCEVRVALAPRKGGPGELVGVACFEGDGQARLGPCADFEPPGSRWAFRAAELRDVHTDSNTSESGTTTHGIGFRVHFNRRVEGLLGVAVVMACKDGDDWTRTRESYDLRMWPFHWRGGESAALTAGVESSSGVRMCQTSAWLRTKVSDEIEFSDLAVLCEQDGVVEDGPCPGAPEGDPAEPA